MKFQLLCSRATIAAPLKFLKRPMPYMQNTGQQRSFFMIFNFLIDDVRAYQKENPMNVRLADLSKSETELVREDMQKKGLSL